MHHIKYLSYKDEQSVLGSLLKLFYQAGVMVSHLMQQKRELKNENPGKSGFSAMEMMKPPSEVQTLMWQTSDFQSALFLSLSKIQSEKEIIGTARGHCAKDREVSRDPCLCVTGG